MSSGYLRVSSLEARKVENGHRSHCLSNLRVHDDLAVSHFYKANSMTTCKTSSLMSFRLIKLFSAMAFSRGSLAVRIEDSTPVVCLPVGICINGFVSCRGCI